MKKIIAVTLFAIVPLSFASGQGRSPSTSPPMGAPDSQISAEQAQKHFTHDSSVHYQPAVNPKAGDWNATGVVDTRAMSDAQFAQFKALHPNAVFVNRCYIGENPDPNARAMMRQNAGTDGSCGS